MQKSLSPLWQICLYAFGYLCVTSSVVLAQVTSDGTVNTQVNQDGNVAEITGGETRGGNLFHSFQDFSVPTDNSAFFNNADSIANIFSRVTGGNISNIDGLIRANGDAHLFLINPAGIVFGENARLDLGGSFYGSTADSVLFEDGQFSASDLDNPLLLTINAPIGLGFRDNPGEIVNRANFGLTVESFGQDIDFEPVTTERITSITGLEVDPGQNLALIGGNITLDRSGLTAPGGNVTLGGLSQAGTVAISPEGIFSFPENVTKANVSLSNSAIVSVLSIDGGGTIDIRASNSSISLDSQLRRNPIMNNITEAELPRRSSVGGLKIEESRKSSVEIEQTITQVCKANREIAAKNNFVIEGRGGITPEPGLPLNSSNIYVDGDANQKSAIPKPIETSQGKIQPARGIEVTKDDKIILTAYRTNNAGQRIFQGKQYCNQ